MCDTSLRGGIQEGGKQQSIPRTVAKRQSISADQPDLRTMLCEITSRLEARTRDQSRGRNQKRSASRSRQTENPDHCWYHRKFKQ
ncbi:hypothetical protein CEXT_357151 [Caerostris extrusa]|uniref:Uncharacterized protein n=1 Tax=Caerostris extrusa TaxID=172846 RepID=A0AAV4SQ71_CAEEX|nr:hypothetical protein CEXT_357151 [Caerostris extrusa]